MWVKQIRSSPDKSTAVPLLLASTVDGKLIKPPHPVQLKKLSTRISSRSTDNEIPCIDHSRDNYIANADEVTFKLKPLTVADAINS